MKVDSIWRYPVKSCGGNELESAAMDSYGLTGDRHFGIATAAGKLLTQKTVAKLNLMKASLTEDHLHLSFPGMPDFAMSLAEAGSPITMDVYGPVPAESVGGEVSKWLSSALDRPLILARSTLPFERPMPAFAAHLFLDLQYRFADASPLHLISQSSLDDLSRRIGEEMSISRFRPNIVVDGGEPYDEDCWTEIRIGEIKLEMMDLTERCGVPLVKPYTSKRGIEPLRTLRAYRTRPEHLTNGIVFGTFLKPVTSGTIRRGDRVEILRVKEKPVLSQASLVSSSASI